MRTTSNIVTDQVSVRGGQPGDDESRRGDRHVVDDKVDYDGYDADSPMRLLPRLSIIAILSMVLCRCAEGRGIVRAWEGVHLA